MNTQQGQSMTEFIVAASFVLIPLFIIVPTVGKYIDMKQAAINSARYATWEFSAHYVDLRDQPAGFSALSSRQLPLKSHAQVANEAKRRFYSNTNVKLDTQKDKTGYKSDEKNHLWTYHNGLPMYIGDGVIAGKGSSPTPDKLKILNGLLGIVGAGLNYISSAFSALGIPAGFNAMNPDGNISIDGRYSTSVKLPVEPAPEYMTLKEDSRAPLFGKKLDLKMQAKSGLLTETWGAGGKSHTIYQAGGLVPTTLIGAVFNKPPLNTLVTIASTVLLSPEIDGSSLKWGYPVFPKADQKVMDQVPVGAIDGDTRKLDCSGQYCEQ